MPAHTIQIERESATGCVRTPGSAGATARRLVSRCRVSGDVHRRRRRSGVARARNFGRDAARSVEKTQSIVAIENAESLAHVRETDAAARPRRAVEPHAVVGHAHHELVVVHGGPDSIVPAALRPLKPVTNGVLHQRLQDEARYEAVDRRVVDAILDRQPVGEANALNVEIRLEPTISSPSVTSSARCASAVRKTADNCCSTSAAVARRVVRELGHGAE